MTDSIENVEADVVQSAAETKDVKQDETKVLETDKISEPEKEKSFKDRVIGTIKDKLGIGVKVESPELSEESPDEFIDAAISAGWTDEDIELFVKDKTPDELLELVPHLVSSVEQPEDKSETKEGAKVDSSVKSETDVEKDKDVDALLEKLLPKLQEKLGIDSVKTLTDEIRTEREANNTANTLKRADDLMDDLSKEFKEFGQRKDMPVYPAGNLKGQLIPTSPQFKARSELYGFAVPFMRSGQSIDDAMANALYTYKGKYLKERTQRDLIKDLKNHEKKLSGPRTAKESKKIYANDREEGIDAIRDILSSQGKEG